MGLTKEQLLDIQDKCVDAMRKLGIPPEVPLFDESAIENLRTVDTTVLERSMKEIMDKYVELQNIHGTCSLALLYLESIKTKPYIVKIVTENSSVEREMELTKRDVDILTQFAGFVWDLDVDFDKISFEQKRG